MLLERSRSHSHKQVRCNSSTGAFDFRCILCSFRRLCRIRCHPLRKCEGWRSCHDWRTLSAIQTVNLASLTFSSRQPDSLGNFVPTSVRSIERKRVRVARGEAGQSIALALKRIRRNEVRKGMVLLAPDATPKAVRRFTASVLILYHQSTIARGYQAQAHIGSIRQTVRILDIDKPFVRTGDRCAVVFEFIKVCDCLNLGGFEGLQCSLI